MEMVVIHSLNHAFMIATFAFVMMMVVDYIEVLTRGKMSEIIKGGHFRQYVIASALAVTPGCVGIFMNVSLYVHGILSFGAITGSMIAASGEGAFVMLTMFPKQAVIILSILFILGILSAFIVDKIVPILKIKSCQVCRLSEIHIEKKCEIPDLKGVFEHLKNMSFVRFLLIIILILFIFGLMQGFIGPTENFLRIIFISLTLLALFIVITAPEHYLEEHIWIHIVKVHLWRIFILSFFALLIIETALQFWNLEAIVKEHKLLVLLIVSLIAILPVCGPHLVFIMMFAKGIIPFSVLLASCIIHDGHGLLPLLSYTIKDSIVIKLISFIIGLMCGLILYMVGL